MPVFRCYTEKREGFDMEAKALLRSLREFLRIQGLESMRILSRYDVEGISQSVYQAARLTVFSEPQTDDIYDEYPPDRDDSCRTLIIEALPGQYDQRADACAQCLSVLSEYTNSEFGIRNSEYTIIVKTAKMYIFNGDISDAEMEKIRGYLINKVESREASHEKPKTLADDHPDPEPIESLYGFTSADDQKLRDYLNEYNLAMDMADLRLLHAYFRDTEKRDPTITELRVIDTYWSDHCRHTTFLTHITDIKINDPEVEAAYNAYLDARREVYGTGADDRPQTLMDLATINSKLLQKRGMLKNIDISDEVNACSIHIDANIGGKTEDWLLMFKNETHNHPTEVEPFGGAATCIGGAIRDPMAGRAHVYQAMRITGAGDPRAAFEDTVPGKLPQRKLTTTAAQGYSSYGNQIGLAAGLLHEIYHPGFIAKRMELGAVVGAIKAENVRRMAPAPGDKVILVGGRTGRDGIGGATGSSKSLTNESIVLMAAEVQKGNAAEEHKIQRLFLDPEVTRMIKKCNDFGAGGVSVAVGELADGLDIDLSLVRSKYNGLNGTELAISESQERMAVAVSQNDAEAFIRKALDENLEAYVIAEVTDTSRMVMRFNGEVIVDLSREFLSTNGAVKATSVYVQGSGVRGQESGVRDQESGDRAQGSGDEGDERTDGSPAGKLKAMVSNLQFCSQLGLGAMFDDMAGALCLMAKNGGKTRSTPIQTMASLLPIWDNETTTASVMAYGYDPYLSSRNPFTGAKTAVITSVAKLVAAGCDPDDAYLTFQEYFESLGNDPARWGKPFTALLGAFEAQMGLGLASIGGKDSMSGSYNDLAVPPTLVSFAIAPNDADNVISPEFKSPGHDIVIFEAGKDLAETKKIWKKVHALIENKTIVAAWAITKGGAAEGIFKMALGNEVGFESTPVSDTQTLFMFAPGAIIAEVTSPVTDALTIGRTIPEPVIKLGDETLSLAELRSAWESTLEPIFPAKTEMAGGVEKISYDKRSVVIAGESFAKPRALIFALPGTNGENETARAVRRAGGVPQILVVRNLTPSMLSESIAASVREIRDSRILILSGGFSFGDEPDGSAKFATVFFRNPTITDAVHEHLKTRGGLILGISGGFQALIKIGLVPFGEITPPGSDAPTLAYNCIGRYHAGFVYTRVASVNSPWMAQCNVGDIHAVAVSHREGRFIATDEVLSRLIGQGQIATQYVDINGNPSMETSINPSGSVMAVEGLFSPDGRVFGKMGCTERYGKNVAKNIYGEKHQPIFESGINYFK